MIAGIGVDLVEVARVERMLGTYGERFVGRVLAESERAGYANSTRQVWFLATRFAAKEAVSKALGTGLRYPVTLHAISVVNNAAGRPELRFHDALPDYLARARIGRIHLSLARRPQDGVDGVELAIRASGLWMTSAQLELLFASIPQADAGVAPRGDWAESGISGSRRVCRLLGGELFVETEGVRRSVLRVWVPDRRAAGGEHRPA